jgi:hypothetical protein
MRARLSFHLAAWPSPSYTGSDVSVRDKSSDNEDPLAELLRANPQQRLKQREADLVPYDYYFSHPEFKVRRPTRRRLRRRFIREV